MLWHWSVDVEKFKKENPRGFRLFEKNKENIQRTVKILLTNKWIMGGRIYIRGQQRGWFRESPLLITTTFKKEIPKYEYVSFGFTLDEEIAPGISIIDQNKLRKAPCNFSLVGEFNRAKKENGRFFSWSCQKP